MDNYVPYERDLLAYTVLYPSLLHRYGKYMLYNDESRSLYAILDKLKDKQENEIPELLLETAVANNEGDCFIESKTFMDLLDRLAKFRNKPILEARKDFNGLIDLLAKRDKGIGMIKILRDSIKLIEDGKINEGLSMAKGLHFEEPKRVDSTEDLMLSSIVESNGFPTGIKTIDQNGGFYRGNIMSITGDTGSQKTMISMWMMLKFLIENPDMKGIYFEKEMAIKDMGLRLVSHLLQIKSGMLQELAIMRDKREKVMRQLEFRERIKSEMKKDGPIQNAFRRMIFVPNIYFDNSTDIYRYIEHHNADFWCLDFVTMLAPDDDDNYYAFIKKQMNEFKSIVHNTGSFGILLAQLKQNTVETRSNKIPQMSDIEWGTQLKQLSASVWATFWPTQYYTRKIIKWDDLFFLIGLKSRNGKIYDLYLNTKPDLAQFEEVDDKMKEEARNWLIDYKQKRT